MRKRGDGASGVSVRGEDRRRVGCWNLGIGAGRFGRRGEREQAVRSSGQLQVKRAAFSSSRSALTTSSIDVIEAAESLESLERLFELEGGGKKTLARAGRTEGKDEPRPAARVARRERDR